MTPTPSMDDSGDPPRPPEIETAAIEDAARTLLRAFVDPAQAELREALAAELFPQPDDFARIFLPEHAEAAALAWARAFPAPAVPRGKPEQIEVQVACATGAELAAGGPAAGAFPGGWVRVAGLLRPEPLWFAWRFAAPGSRLGTAYDGLVRLDARTWRWLPRPWRWVG